MNSIEIFTENPLKEQWQMLMQFSYLENCKRYLMKHNEGCIDQKCLDIISCSISQAKEYFDASQHVSLNVSPLLLYYGTTNLLIGASHLILNKVIKITDHGMKLPVELNCSRIADNIIKAVNPNTGGLSQFINAFYNNLDFPFGHTLKLLDIFGSIPELLYEYSYSYPKQHSHLIRLKIKEKKDHVFEEILLANYDGLGSIDDDLERIEGFRNNYICQGTESSIILRRKLSFQDVGIYSISGEKFLQIPILIGGKYITIPVLILMYIALFALGYLSRYHPEIWNPFLRTDNTGEKHLIEKFLNVCRRKIPNYILDFIFNNEINFVNKQYSNEVVHENQDDSEIKNLIREEIRNILYEERMR